MKEAIQDYKELFLTPIRARGMAPGGGAAAAEAQRVHIRTSNIKANKEAIVLKSEQEEKQETKDLAKFAAQLTAPYLSKVEKILLKLESGTELREALRYLD